MILVRVVVVRSLKIVTAVPEGHLLHSKRMGSRNLLRNGRRQPGKKGIDAVVNAIGIDFLRLFH
jgi:hypothetical protein